MENKTNGGKRGLAEGALDSRNQYLPGNDSVM